MVRLAYTPKPTEVASIDVREWPMYSLAEVAYFLDIPKTTVHTWTKSYLNSKNQLVKPLIEPIDRLDALFSFYNLTEAHILSVTTKTHGVKVGAIRAAMAELLSQNLTTGNHPLLSREFFTDGKHLFVKLVERTVNLSVSGQLGLRPILDSYLERIERDDAFRPQKLYPGKQPGKAISILPGVSSGRPIIDGTGIPVSSVWNRYNAGDSISFIASDYEIQEEQVAGAIKYIEQIEAA